MDARLAGAATKLGFTYTRYADDLTFSGPKTAEAGAMLHRIRFITGAEGFAEHPTKTRVLRKGRRQEVTGVVVNQQLGVDRETLRKFRALLFQVGKDGPAGKSWGASPDLFASAIGYANFVRMVDPAKGEKFLARAKELAAKHGWKPKKRPPPKPPTGGGGGGPSGRPPEPDPTPAPAAPEPGTPPPVKKKKWWQVF